MFTPRELEILGALVVCATQDDDYEYDWGPEDREIMEELTLKLDPKAQSEIHDLEAQLKQVFTEGGDVAK